MRLIVVNGRRLHNASCWKEHHECAIDEVRRFQGVEKDLEHETATLRREIIELNFKLVKNKEEEMIVIPRSRLLRVFGVVILGCLLSFGAGFITGKAHAGEAPDTVESLKLKLDNVTLRIEIMARELEPVWQAKFREALEGNDEVKKLRAQQNDLVKKIQALEPAKPAEKK